MPRDGASRPLIVTARLDRDALERLDALRRRHFPPERNHLSAHLTLFHALPGEQEAAVRDDLAELAGRTPVLHGSADRVIALGRGVAVHVETPGLAPLRAELARRWAPWLTPQDRQRLRPHVTIQNKVEPRAARALHDLLAAGFAPFALAVDGLQLWRYLGGPWEALESVDLAGFSRPASPCSSGP
jgi:2'-5' RNA ligase